MKNRVTRCLLVGALAIGMTSTAMADAAKQLCFQINGDINNSTQIDKIYLTVNTVGMASGNGCFYSISDPSATPSCSPLTGNLTGTFPEAFLSLTGNWQRTIGSEVVSEDTKVSVHYDFKKLSGEGIAKTLKAIWDKPVEITNSAEGSVSRTQCPSSNHNLARSIPKFSSDTKNITGTPNKLTTNYAPTTNGTTPIYSCSPGYTTFTNCTLAQQPDCKGRQAYRYNTTGYVLCGWNMTTGACETTALACQ